MASKRPPAPPSSRPETATHGLARVLSKRGFASRSQAERLVREGRVRVEGILVTDPEARTGADARITVEGASVETAAPVHLMLNKPRGLVTTARDEHGRDTVWANAVLDGPNAPTKTYHVKIDRPPDESLVAALTAGVEDRGEHLSAVSVRSLREGVRNAWLEIVLDEGRNRHIRRLLAAFDIETLRLVRVAIGPLSLGTLAKGDVRALSAAEIEALAAPGNAFPPPP